MMFWNVQNKNILQIGEYILYHFVNGKLQRFIVFLV